MLSSEKDSTDPSSDDKRTYDKLKAVDLSNSDLVKEPTFSIRDYVLFKRNNENKDFVNNWPFSQNNMQLCLNHGVKDLLPPFQSPGLVRNLPRAQDNVKSVLIDKDTIIDSIIKKSSDSSNQSDPNLFVKRTSETNNELESTTATAIYSSKTLNEPSKVSKVATKPSVKLKKCRLIMKYSNIPHIKTKETTALNAPMSSETIAVCPVCRTFSSLSNTTLNAHIDQCLSGDYTIKTVTSTKMNRHKIKPRKVRLMVNIYKTAPHCTLEELDRRNGSNWASNRTFSPPEVEISADPKGLCLNVKETTTSGDGSVYVDSNGTKLRILSKFGNPSNSKVVGTSQTRKILKGGEKSLGLMAKKIKKMKNQIQKQQKCSSLDKYGKKISNGQDGIISLKEVDEKDECMEKQHKASDQAKLTETVKAWACSKKTGVMKKINSADHKRNSQERVNGNSLAKRGLSFLATNSHVKKLNDLKFPSVDKRPLKIRKTHAGNYDNSVSNPITSSGDRSLLSKTQKFSSLSKKLSSASYVSALNSRFSPKKKILAVKKFKVFTSSDSDEEETPSHSGTDHSQDFLHKVTEEGDTSSEESYDRKVVLKVRNGSRESIASREEDIALRSSRSTSMHSNHDPDSWNKNVSLMLGSVANVEHLSEVAIDGQFTRFSDSMETGFIGLPGRCIYEAEAAANLTSGQDIFSANLMPEKIENVGVMVDQIPIPGPPGSFLPSPRHMDSDELQGNSSLTSTRVQSHDEHQDFADQSSESHASDISTVSNCNIYENLPVGPPKSMEISASTIAANVMACPLKLNIALTEIPSPNHPCCCCRKEVFLRKIASNYQNSPLLLRRTMDNSNSSSSVIHVVQGGDCTKSVAGIVSSSVYNDNQKSVSPAPSTPVLRLMGKNLIVVNNDESNMHLDLKHSLLNSGLHHSNDTLSKLYRNYDHSTTPQATTTSVTNLDELMDQSEARDFMARTSQVMGFIRNGGVCMSKFDPRNTSPYSETEEYVYGRPVVNRSVVDSSGLVQHPHGANSELVKWNCTL